MAYLIMRTQTHKFVGFIFYFPPPGFSFFMVNQIRFGMRRDVCFLFYFLFLGFDSAGVKMIGCCGC